MIASRPMVARAAAVTAMAMTLVGYTALQARAGTLPTASLPQPAEISLSYETHTSEALADNCYLVVEQVIGRSGKLETRRSHECD